MYIPDSSGNPNHSQVTIRKNHESKISRLCEVYSGFMGIEFGFKSIRFRLSVFVFEDVKYSTVFHLNQKTLGVLNIITYYTVLPFPIFILYLSDVVDTYLCSRFISPISDPACFIGVDG